MRAVNSAYGTDTAPDRITTRDVLDFATLQGARTNGLDSITGSLTPGKQADVLIVNATDVNTMPLNDAVGTLVLGADPRNIETVLVGGVLRKSGGRLVGVDVAQLHEQVVASRDAIRATAAS